MDIDSVVNLYAQFFKAPVKQMPQEIPCVLRDGLDSVKDKSQLPLGSLDINQPPELLLALVLGIYLTPSPSWEPLVRSIVIHIYSDRSASAIDHRMIQASWDIQTLGENMSLNALEQADVVQECRQRLAATPGAKSTIDAVCEQFKAATSNDIKRFGDKKLVTILLKISDAFYGFHGARAAFQRMTIRHGKKDSLIMQPYKVLPFAQVCNSPMTKHYLPEIICMLDAMLMRNQLGGA